jgi:hypothetical protein
MEEVMCAMALKSADGRQKHHTKTGLRVCCERALKSAGERTTQAHGPAGPSAAVRGRAVRGGAPLFGKPPARKK